MKNKNPNPNPNINIVNPDDFFKKFSDTSNVFVVDLEKLMISNVQTEFLLENLFVKDRVILINGRRGSRKTTLMYALAHALINDNTEDFLGFKINKRHQYQIFYFDAENSLQDIKKLAFNINTHLFYVFSNSSTKFTLPKLDKEIKFNSQCFLQDTNFRQLIHDHLLRFAKNKNTSIDKLNTKEKNEFVKKLEKNYTCKKLKQCTNFYHHYIFWSKIQGYHPILIFDALSYFKGSAKENSDEMSAIMEKFREFRNAGATVFVLQNSGKSETSASRGHSTIEDFVDATFQIVAPNDPIFNNTSEYHHLKCLGKNRGASSDISLYLDFIENDDFIEIINKTNIQKENLEYILLSIIAQNEKISKFELIKKTKQITSKSNQQHKKINDTLSDLVMKKFIRYETVKKEGKGRPVSYYWLTAEGENILEQFKKQKEHSFIIPKPLSHTEDYVEDTKTFEENLVENSKNNEDEIIHSDGVFTVVQRSTAKPPKQPQHKPRNPNCQKCAPSDCQYFAEENRYWCHWFKAWCDSITEGRKA